MSTRSPAYVWPTLLFLGCALALANGFAYGIGNQWQYLLHGRRLLDPTFLANDWLAGRTQSHHAAFAWMLALLGKLWSIDVALAWANALFALACLGCVYALAARYYRAPVVVAAVTLLIMVFSPRSTIGMSNLMMSYFQPSTIGSIGLLAGSACLVYGRYKTAGAIWFVASLFHLSFTIWIGLIAGVVILVNWKKIGPRRSLYLVVPIVLSAAYHVPFILASRTPEQALHAAASAHIMHDIYMPGHSRPLTWGLDPFIRFGSVLAAGFVAVAMARGERRLGRMAASILGAIAAIIGLGMLFTIVIPIDTVALLFPYRLAPQLILAAQIACAGALVTTAQADRVSLPRTLLLWTILAVLLYGSGIRSLYGLSCIYSAVAVLFAGRLGEERSIPAWLLGAVVAGLLAILTWAGAGWSGAGCAGIFLAAGLAKRATNGPASAHPVPSRLPSASAVALPLLIGACLMQIGAARKDFLGPPPPADEQILYTWCQARTNRDDVFITPPALSSFRLGAERAIVIDSRCIAILPSEILEWYHRLVDECGTEFDSLSAADAAYRTLDVDRARRVAARYGAQYLVTERAQHRGDLTDLRQVYANPTFAVYALTPVTPEAAQGSYPRTMFLSTIARMPPLR